MKRNKCVRVLNKISIYFVLVMMLLALLLKPNFSKMKVYAQESQAITYQNNQLNIELSKIDFMAALQKAKFSEKVSDQTFLEKWNWSNDSQDMLAAVKKQNYLSLSLFNQEDQAVLEQLQLQVNVLVKQDALNQNPIKQSSEEPIYFILGNLSERYQKVVFSLNGQTIEELQLRGSEMIHQDAITQENTTQSKTQQLAYAKITKFSLQKIAMQQYHAAVDDFDVEVVTSKHSFSEPVKLKVTRVGWQTNQKNMDTFDNKQKKILKEQGISSENALALNIRFENKEGKEIEPRYPADVRIHLNAKWLREKEIDPTTLSVVHMKENQSQERYQPEVVASVSSSAEGSFKAIKNNEEVALSSATEFADHQRNTLTSDTEKIVAEFSVDSFSNYLIRWDKEPDYKLRFIFKLQDRNNIESELYPNDMGDGNIVVHTKKEFDDLAYSRIKPLKILDMISIPQGYYYVKSYVKLQSTRYDVDSVQPYWWSLYKYYKFYKNDSYVADSSGTDQYVYVVLKKSYDRPEVIQTEDTAKDIQISLFDYTATSDNQQINGFGRKLHFNYGGVGNGYYGINDYTGQGPNPNQKIVMRNLDETGSPVLTHNYGSLSYLFPNAKNILQGINFVRHGLNHLFIKDADGNLVYDSSKNFATLNRGQIDFFYESKVTNDFVVYNRPLKYERDTSSAQFQPFSDINKDGLLMTQRNLWFGMKIDTNILQPVGGQITTPSGEKKDMVFDFNGDDDLWVFIDGMKILDLGGIHDQTPGSINFATGVVNAANGGITTIADQVRAAVREKYPNQNWTDEQINQMYGLKGNTFADTTSHRMQIFYFERGEGESNLRVKMNLYTLPKGTVYLGKTVTIPSELSLIQPTNLAYDFLVEKREGNNYQPYNGSYDLYEGNIADPKNAKKINQQSLTMTDGKLQLKPNQFIVLSNLDENEVFRMTELVTQKNATAAYQDLYDVITNIQSAKLESTKVKIGEKTYQGYVVDQITPKTHPVIHFNNQIKGNNLGKLFIEKRMKAGQSSDDSLFSFKVLIDQLPYKGSYRVIEGNTVTSKQTLDGIIKLKVGQKAEIDHILWGTPYQVTEVSAEGYDEPIYKQKITWQPRDESEQPDVNEKVVSGDKVSGNIPLEKASEVSVIVINQKKEWTPPPTGLSYKIAPYLVGGLVLAISYLYYRRFINMISKK